MPKRRNDPKPNNKKEKKGTDLPFGSSQNHQQEFHSHHQKLFTKLPKFDDQLGKAQTTNQIIALQQEK